MGPGFRPEMRCGAKCPARRVWQGSGFAADQTNAMLAVGGTSCISLVSAAAADENSLTPLHRRLPTETAALGFGGSPVGGGDKSSRKRKPLHLLGITAYAEEFSICGREMKCFFIRFSRDYFPCTQRFFGVPVWGWYHYPRRALHAAETLDAQGAWRRIRRFYAVSEFAPCGQNIHGGYTRHPNPEPRTQRLTRRNTAGSQGRW